MCDIVVKLKTGDLSKTRISYVKMEKNNRNTTVSVIFVEEMFVHFGKKKKGLESDLFSYLFGCTTCPKMHENKLSKKK